MPKKVSIAERLLTRIKITERGCWEWQGARQPPHGYGFFKHNQIVMRAHRASFEEFRYPIPEGMSICHTCDNPCCVYPLHLFPGTAQDNVDDCKSKGRTKTGEKHWNNRLSGDQAKEIIRRHGEGEKPKDLGREFGISSDHVWQIVSGTRWKHLPRDKALAPNIGETAPTAKLSNQDVLNIRASRANGVKIKDLASTYGMSKTQISRICNGTRWRHLA